MRALTGLLVLAAMAVAPASALAQEPMCRFDNRDVAAGVEFQQPFATYLTKVQAGTGAPRGGEADDAVRAVLGSQFTLLWLDFERQGWTVAYSAGPHDAASARAAIRAQLAARLDPAAVDFLDRTLTLVPTPYSRAELEALLPLLAGERELFSGFAVGCQWSDGVRVEIGVGAEETPELRARVEALLAPYGDKVRVRYGQGWARPGLGIAGPHEPPVVPTTPPAQPLQRPTLAVRDYVSLTRTSRCARTVSARPRSGAAVKRVRLAAGTRASAGTRARIKLKARRTRVTVTVTLRDGGVAVETLTYRRCR